MISYAQNAEDVVLARAFGDRNDGFFVDVGANDPTHDSVTRHFYERGWNGVNIEPLVRCFDALQEARPRDVNLNVGVGQSPGRLKFYLVPEARAMSTFSARHAELVREMGYRTVQTHVDVRTLDDVFAEHVRDRTVDFLKVDVEGLEDEVLGTFDWARWRPRVVLVESWPEVSAWEERLLGLGYQRTLWDGINLFFVRDEDAAELTPVLRRPATIVLDKYDPWHYAEQLLRWRKDCAVLLQHYLVGAMQQRAPSRADPEVAVAARALATVLSERSDVVDRFGAPPDTDVVGLLSWAGRGKKRHGEPHVEALVPYQALYRRMTRGRTGIMGAKELGRLAVDTGRPLVPQALRQRLRTRALARQALHHEQM